MRRRLWAPAAAAVTLLAYLPALRFPFLEWDDKLNLVDNARYRGLGLENLRWMFTTHHLGPYQPLSWLSFSLDWALWGGNPAGYHLTNALLHAAGAALLFLICERLLKSRWQALFTALFFSLHPLRVESVAWVTERRDVLSGFFFLLACWGYVRQWRRRWVLGAFAAALLSKATAVGLLWTLPALDVYALGRPAWDPRRWREKAPYFVAAALAAAANLYGFSTGDLRAAHYGLAQRLAICLHGLAFYARKTAWPAALSPYYPLPLALSEIAPTLLLHGAAALAITAALVARRKRWPAALAAWACYALILAPVSGLAQNGQQLAADRYSYLACLPFAPLAAAALGALGGRRAAAIGLLVLSALFAATERQLSYWRDDVPLWERAVALSPDNYLAQSNLATLLFKRGDHERAAAHFEQALRLLPRDREARLNLGAIYEERGDLAAAAAQYQAALDASPLDAEAGNNLAIVLIKQGRWDEAEKRLRAIVERSPGFAPARANLATLRKRLQQDARGRRRQ